MRTDGACGLLFCAAKQSGAFPTNMPAGLRARVSRLGGFTRPFFGYLFPPETLAESTKAFQLRPKRPF